MIISQTV